MRAKALANSKHPKHWKLRSPMDKVNHAMDFLEKRKNRMNEPLNRHFQFLLSMAESVLSVENY